MNDARRIWEANVHFDGVTPLVTDDYEHCTYPLCVMHHEAVAPPQSRLEAYETAVRDLLPNIEWEGESWGDPACPACGGLMPLLHESDPPYQQRSITRFGVGHQEWCELARLRELSEPRDGGQG